ncbi:hypothetical protein [Nocardia crassostreae]|nr:hypothetical protein [Nocardia crassostreae]
MADRPQPQPGAEPPTRGNLVIVAVLAIAIIATLVTAATMVAP